MQLDGIRAPRRYMGATPQRRVVQPQQDILLPELATPRKPLRVPTIKIPIAVWALLVVGTASAVLLRPATKFFTAEASTIPSGSTTRSTELPITFVETNVQSHTNDQVVAIDQPTADSLAQPDVTPAVAAATTTKESSRILPTVRVLNGGASAGKATSVGTQLEQQHYHVLATGNAQFSYVQTTIYYLPGNKEGASTIATVIGHADATLTEDPIASPADVLVVLGNDLP